MDRRDFSKLAGSGILAAPMLIRAGPVSANPIQNNEEGDGSRLEPFGRLFYRGQGARVLLTGLILLSVSGLWFANVQQGAPQFNENRIATSGLLGGLTRPTIDERIARAQLIGTVVLFQTNLVGLLNPELALAQARFSALVVHRQISWEVSRMARANALSGLPALNDLRLLTIIGTLYLLGQTIMMILPPPDYAA